MSDVGMKQLEKLHEKKITRRIGEISGHVWSDHISIDDIAVHETMEHLPVKEAMTLKYIKVKPGHLWGKPWGTIWTRLRLSIPKSMRGATVGLLFNSTGEDLIFRNAKAVQGMSWSRREYILTDKAKGNEKIELFIESGADGDQRLVGKRAIGQPNIAVFNKDIFDAYWDLKALNDMIERGIGEQSYGGVPRETACLREHSVRRDRIAYTLNKAVDLYDYNTNEWDERNLSARKIRKILKPLYDCKANASATTIAAMGHAHLDVAWLWPLAETIRKCGRTFANVLELMKRYPSFIFCQSQPHLYEFARDNYPDLYQQVKVKAKQGKWIPTGGAWVEMDCNVPNGESFVRQLLFGTRFFKKEFNHDTVCLWLPDVFGYSAALPQILKRSGIDYFTTYKLTWSQFTRFPYNSFHWEGIDGSKVLTHFFTARDYNSELEARDMISSERVYHEKDRSSIHMVPYGHGDGGGGPTRDHLERLIRYGDIEDLPKVTPMTPADFFKQLDAESDTFPKWVGELYLEFHRGTYTTQAYTKKNNRLSEIALHDTEWLSVLDMLQGGAYQQSEINQAWKLVLLNQFHDILPGSSIDEVYEDADRDYAKAFEIIAAVREQVMERLAKKVDTLGDGEAVLVYNSLPWKRKDLAVVTTKNVNKKVNFVAVASNGDSSPVQIGHDNKARFIADYPSLGHDVFHIRKSSDNQNVSVIAIDERHIENDCVRITLDELGRVNRILDKKNKREVLASGSIGNQFILFEDKSVSCGAAWDIDIFYNDKPIEYDGKLQSIEVIEEGAVRSVLRVTRSISKSTIIQDIILTAGSSRIDFETKVEWGAEKDVLLKVAFPVNVRSEKARYEIQYGNVERPTHGNMPKDFAQFEVPAQKWVDLSEVGYGVALLNDCKYGHDTQDNVMRLTLLRATKSPGKNADVNKLHTFTYSILPHEGDYSNGVVRSGYELNISVMAEKVKASKGSVPATQSYFSITGDNVVIDSVKKAEDDDGIIVRMYEAHGARGRRTFSTSLPISKVIETNLMEKEERELKSAKGKVQLTFNPFQIRTLKLLTKNPKKKHS
jgi:alpha-mannosidase